jgi:hypothetical protein
MPGAIPATNSGSLVKKIRKNIGSQMGQTGKKSLIEKNNAKKEVI